MSQQISINKDRIKLTFSRAASSYDGFATLQKEVADRLLMDFISPLTTHHAPRSILDIGCGTGFLTYGLAELFPQASISGCDIAHPMVKIARLKNEEAPILFTTANGESLPYKDKVFDIVASNLTYQWVPDMGTAFLEAYRVLRRGGFFIFSTLGCETLKELRNCYREVSAMFSRDGLPPFMVFSDKETILSVLKDKGFKDVSIETTNIIKTYQDMWALLKTLKSIGAGNPFQGGDKSLARGSILKKMAEVYKQVFSVQCSVFSKKDSLTYHSSLTTGHCIYATYEVIFGIARKGLPPFPFKYLHQHHPCYKPTDMGIPCDAATSTTTYNLIDKP